MQLAQDVREHILQDVLGPTGEKLRRVPAGRDREDTVHKKEKDNLRMHYLDPLIYKKKKKATKRFKSKIIKITLLKGVQFNSLSHYNLTHKSMSIRQANNEDSGCKKS